MSNYIDHSQLVNPYEIKTTIHQTSGGRRMQIESSMTFDGKRHRQAIIRKPIDYHHSIATELEDKLYKQSKYEYYIPPSPNFQHLLYPSSSLTSNPSWDILTHFTHASTNKVRCAINVVSWTPQGRRLITGTANGEFTLWNGREFNFETIQQAHDAAVRAIVWTHNDQFMTTADNKGEIRYWQDNMNNLKRFQGHEACIRDISFSPTDKKFVTCSDDATLKIWDFGTYTAEKLLKGHSSDVKCCDWHPSNSLIVSGSKDSVIKIWDAKSEKEVSSLYGHKSTLFRTKWNKNGNWILSCGKDQLIKVFDIRFMKEASYTFRGHKKEVTSIAWHPFHERLFVSGAYDGEIMYWCIGNDDCQGKIPNAHDGAVWDLAWHPLGHILASGSNDFTTKFWSRNKPGDKMRDKYNVTQLPEGSIPLEFTEEKVEVAESIPGIKRDRSPEEEEEEDFPPQKVQVNQNRNNQQFQKRY